MRKVIQAGMCSLVLGATTVSADDPCWSFGFASEGDLCWLIDEDMPNKVLLGKVVLPKDASKSAQCKYENPIKQKSATGSNFAFLLGDFKGIQRIIQDREPILSPRFIARFSYCDINSQKAKAHPISDVTKLSGSQDQVCMMELRGSNSPGIQFGLWNTEKNSCESIGVTYQASGSKKNEKYQKVCLYELLRQHKGWATNGPKGKKSNYGTTGKNWHQGMHQCLSAQESKRELMPYCSWDQNGDYYYGASQDPNDNGDGYNAIVKYRCLYELMED